MTLPIERKILMNKIAEMLDEVASTGQMPSRDDVTELMVRGDRNQRDTARRAINIAAKRILNRLADDDPTDLDDDLAELRDTTAEQHAAVLRPSRDEQEVRAGRKLADEIRGRAGEATVDRDRRLADARDARAVRKPLEELLKLAGAQGGIDPRDVDALVLKDTLTGDEKVTWRADLARAASRVVKVHRTGAQADASRLAVELSERLSGALAPAQWPCVNPRHAAGDALIGDRLSG
jgi:hypothetical protein